jgi:hypothetical protein
LRDPEQLQSAIPADRPIWKADMGVATTIQGDAK